jgi:hypothetical protein
MNRRDILKSITGIAALAIMPFRWLPFIKPASRT